MKLIDFERNQLSETQDLQSQSIASHMYVRTHEKGSPVTQKIKKFFVREIPRDLLMFDWLGALDHPNVNLELLLLAGATSAESLSLKKRTPA